MLHRQQRRKKRLGGAEIPPVVLQERVLTDPKRLAKLLLRACTANQPFSTASFLESSDGSTTETSVMKLEETQHDDDDGRSYGGKGEDDDEEVRSYKAEDDDEEEEDAEQMEEEQEEADEEEDVDGPDDDAEHDGAEEAQRTPQERVKQRLEATGAALQVATQIVEELRLQMLLYTSRQYDMQQQEQNQGETLSTPWLPGVPNVHAQPTQNPFCRYCRKSFNAFHRSRNCSTCGYSYCLKCVSRRQVLPTCFGYRDEAQRICELCSAWFQKSMDRYFDIMDLANPTTQHGESSPLPAGQMMNSFSSSSHSTQQIILSANDDEDNDEEAERSRRSPNDAYKRRHRHSISIPTSSKSATKPWFRGHLRAMHVNDRLPRRKTKNDGDMEADDPQNKGSRVLSSSNTPPLSPRTHHSEFPEGDYAVDITKQQQQGENVHVVDDENKDGESSEGEDANAEDDAFVLEELIADEFKLPPAQNGIESAKDNRNVVCKPIHQYKKSRRSKFSRSASYDFTNMQPPRKIPSSPKSDSSQRSSASSVSGERTSITVSDSTKTDRKSTVSKKCFDDSDIVDARRSQTTDEQRLSNVGLPAAVLRFAVDDIRAKESQGLKRALGFGKVNPVLDRYTLELDCGQGIVRVKSVFMHRYWSFPCDVVQEFTFGPGEGVARLVIFNGGTGNQTLEFKFANDEERGEFKQAMENCRSTSLREIRVSPSDNRDSQSPLPQHPSLVPDSPIPAEMIGSPNDVISTVTDAEQQESSMSIGDEKSGACSVESPLEKPVHFDILPGEVVVKNTKFPATLLIGPGGDSVESALVWGRLRGMIAVTNYRVVFMPFEQGTVPYRAIPQGSIAYVPLFAITFVQLLYPSGRRPKSSRVYYGGLSSVVTISCKDVRIMRFQLDGEPNISDQRAQSLHSIIAKMADASQRYKAADRDQGNILMNIPPFLSATGISYNDSDNNKYESSEANGQASNLKNSFSPANSASPVLQSKQIPPVKFEVSGSFAFMYSTICPSPELNGWNLFVDEREFKRQIAGDTSVLPFLKFYLNGRGNICQSYPRKLLLPSSMNSATLVKVAAFRAKNRLPVITYYHQRNRCVLTRSSQPLLGNLLSGSSNLSDQLLVGVYRRLPDIIKNQSHSSASSRPIYIFDARKLKASTGNRLMGKGGVETPQDYPGAVIHHLNIANMYRMQSSFLSLMKLLLPGGSEDNDRTWWASIESTRWLGHVRVILDGALKIARVLELEGSSVLVHCSDGWDRTSQLTALAQLMIDPYYRTIRGFAVLVEKDWCAFGHKFAERLGGDRSKDPQRSKSSPVMFQFLDAVWQIQRQFPNAFEFNELFLLYLANSLTSGLYGTFLYDSRLQRDVNEVEINSVSVWTPVLMNPGPFINSKYTCHEQPIWPWTSHQMVRLWDNYFFQWHPKYYNCHWRAELALQGARVDRTATQQQQQDLNSEPNDQQPMNDAGAAPDIIPLSRTTLASRESPENSNSNNSSKASSAAGSIVGPKPTGQRTQAPMIPLRNIFLYKS